ncbi:MAG: glycosyltransferase family 4 protein [Pigmentiphaga sp.]
MMAAILAVSGRRATQIACSARMLHDLKDMYPGEFEVIAVPNTVWVPVVSAKFVPCDNDLIRLGFLSNLNPQKGVFRAIETLRCLQKNGEQAILYIAGAAPSSGLVPDFEELAREFGNAIAYLGKIEGEEKERFFLSIDYFLFPSLYVHETQSLVVPEALSYGINVVACNHRYVPELIGDCGHVIDDAEAFSEMAARWIIEDRSSRLACDGKKDAIARQYAVTHRQSEEALKSLIAILVP